MRAILLNVDTSTKLNPTKPWAPGALASGEVSAVPTCPPTRTRLTPELLNRSPERKPKSCYPGEGSRTAWLYLEPNGPDRAQRCDVRAKAALQVEVSE